MKKIALLIFFCILIHIVIVPAQQQFQISYHPYPLQQKKYIANANGGGYLLASDVTLSSGEKAIILTRINDQFSIVWNKLINEAGVAERVSYFYQDNNGNIFIAGYIDATVRKALTIKTDSSANLLWKYIYNNGINPSEAWRIYKANTGSVYVTGYAQDTLLFGPSNHNMALLMKLNSSGILQWAKTYPAGIYYSSQGEILPFSNGKLVVAGADNSLNISYTNLIKYDTSGNILWKHRYPTVDYVSSTSSTGLDDIILSASGNYLLFGSSNFALQNDRNYIMRCDSLGAMVQYKVFTIPYNSSQHFINVLSAIQTPDGGFALSGSMYTTGIVLLKMNSNLTPQWGRLYFGNYYCGSKSLLRCPDGGYLIAGNYAQDSSIVLIKTDSLGWSSCHETAVTTADSSFSFTADPPYMDVQIPSLYQSVYNGVMSIGTSVFSTDSLCNIFMGYLEENISPTVSIFPNPFSVSATIQIYDVRFTKYDFVLYDITGREVLNLKLQTSNLKLAQGNLKSGIYFYKVTGDKGQGVREMIGTGKIIID